MAQVRWMDGMWLCAIACATFVMGAVLLRPAYFRLVHETSYMYPYMQRQVRAHEALAILLDKENRVAGKEAEEKLNTVLEQLAYESRGGAVPDRQCPAKQETETETN